MTNTDLLKERIKSSGYKMRFLAEQLGISPQAFYNKMENKTQFLAGEIMKLSGLLHLESAEKDLIFFHET